MNEEQSNARALNQFVISILAGAIATGGVLWLSRDLAWWFYLVLFFGVLIFTFFKLGGDDDDDDAAITEAADASFLVQGSAARPYRVRFYHTDDGVRTDCSCPAGQKTFYCKHRIRILENRQPMNIQKGNKRDVQRVQDWYQNTELQRAIAEMEGLAEDLDDDRVHIDPEDRNDMKQRLRGARGKVRRLMMPQFDVRASTD